MRAGCSTCGAGSRKMAENQGNYGTAIQKTWGGGGRELLAWA